MTSASPLAEPAAPASAPLQAPLPPLPELSPAQAAGLDDPDLLAQCVVDIPLGSSLRRIGLGLSGMYCAACAITIEDALQHMEECEIIQDYLGKQFVQGYVAVKRAEHENFKRVISSWEREFLMMSV